jgi:hypothetical protein
MSSKNMASASDLQSLYGMPRSIVVGPGIAEPFEVGARLLSILAFPLRKEHAARHQAELVTCSEILRLTIEKDAAQSASLASTYPHYSTTQKAAKSALNHAA